MHNSGNKSYLDKGPSNTLNQNQVPTGLLVDYMPYERRKPLTYFREKNDVIFIDMNHLGIHDIETTTQEATLKANMVEPYLVIYGFGMMERQSPLPHPAGGGGSCGRGAL